MESMRLICLHVVIFASSYVAVLAAIATRRCAPRAIEQILRSTTNVLRAGAVKARTQPRRDASQTAFHWTPPRRCHLMPSGWAGSNELTTIEGK